jgi:hypothetical protein
MYFSASYYHVYMEGELLKMVMMGLMPTHTKLYLIIYHFILLKQFSNKDMKKGTLYLYGFLKLLLMIIKCCNVVICLFMLTLYKLIAVFRQPRKTQGFWPC